MKKNRLILFLIAALLLLSLLFAFLFGFPKSPYQWRETYDETKQDPYGTKILFQLLKELSPEDSLTIIDKTLVSYLPQDATDENYIFIGNYMYMSEEDTYALLDFVERGNTAIISSNSIPYDLMFHLTDSTCYDIWWEDVKTFSADSVIVNFTHPSLKMDKNLPLAYFNSNGKKEQINWSYFADDFFCDESYSPIILGYFNNDFINFARLQHGQGKFYLHTTPLAFTNINLLKERDLAYAENMFSHLTTGSIYWDSYSRVANKPPASNPNQDSSTRTLPKENALKYILSQPPLAWAWYTALGLALLYFVFRAKRQQPVIPVKEPNTNTSLEFVSTVGRLYFLQNNHRQLALEKMQIFIGNLKERYRINFSELDEATIKKVAMRAEMPEAYLAKIVKIHKNVKDSVFVSENTLVEFHQLIEQFGKRNV